MAWVMMEMKTWEETRPLSQSSRFSLALIAGIPTVPSHSLGLRWSTFHSLG